MKKISFAVIGFGFMGQTHAGSIVRLPGAELAAVVDSRDPAALSRQSGNLATRRIDFSQLAGVPFFKSAEEALARPEIDAVVIATPTPFHASGVLAALAAGKHVFVEKPLCLTLAEAEELRRAAERSDRILQVGYVTRFQAAYRYLADAVKSGRYGALRCLHLTRYTGAPAWREAGGAKPGIADAVLDLCIHDIDFAISLFGEPEKFTVDPEIHGAFQTSLLASTWRFRNAPPVHIAGGFLLPSTVPFRSGYMAMFDRAMLEFSSDDVECAVYTPDGGSSVSFDPESDPYEAEMRYFLDCVAQGRTPEPGIQAAWTGMTWIDRLYKFRNHLQ